MDKIDNIENFTTGEEIANAVIHGIGFLLSIAALVLLIVFSAIYGDAWYVVSFTIYGSTLVLLYISSTLYHSLPKGTAKNVFEIFDHSSIYLLIAGTYTPIILTCLRGALGWTIFGIVWGMCITGIVFKVFWVKKNVILSTIIYIVMGWLIIIAAKPLLTVMTRLSLIFLITGGVLYTAGSIFYVWRKFKYHHAIWHVFVLAGSICHFFAILFLLHR